MKLSARNQLQGTVQDIHKGAVNAIVKLQLPCGQVLCATISLDAVEELGLSVGNPAYAIIKATSVMVGVDG